MTRVLWFVSGAMPAVRTKFDVADFGNQSRWVANAALALSARADIDLGIVWASPLARQHARFSENGVTYFCVTMGGWAESVGNRLRRIPALRNVWQLLTYVPRENTKKTLRDFEKIVADFQPDLVHIHGTEGFYGLLGSRISTPVVISMQGIVNEIAKVYWGSIPIWRRPLFPREMLSHWQMKRNAARELRIIRQNRYFTGRTHWDKDVLSKINPEATYFFDGARLLRDEFDDHKWIFENCTRNRIYTTATSRPYKGTDTLLEALRLVRQDHPAATLHIGGYFQKSGLGRYLRNRIRRLELTDHVKMLGFVEAETIVNELEAAHVYVLGSHVENSPNSVAEAQTIGTPCIATTAGGTPSMVEHEVSGLLYEAGDAPALARQLDRVFNDEQLARGLSEGERERARQRKHEATNASMLVDIYSQILDQHSA